MEKNLTPKDNSKVLEFENYEFLNSESTKSPESVYSRIIVANTL